MSERLSRTARDALRVEQREVFDEIVASRSLTGAGLRLTDDDGVLLGPFNAMVVAPVVGRQLAALGEAVRFRTALTARSRELAILLVAVHERSGFEWRSHEPIALGLGIDESIVARIRRGDHVDLDDPLEQAVVDAALGLVRDGDLDDAHYNAVSSALGEDTVVELAVLIGYYRQLALILRLFRVPENDSFAEAVRGRGDRSDPDEAP